MGLADAWVSLLGGIAGVTLLYLSVMTFIALSRHRRECRMEERQVKMERMVRDLWVDWVRRKPDGVR